MRENTVLCERIGRVKGAGSQDTKAPAVEVLMYGVGRVAGFRVVLEEPRGQAPVLSDAKPVTASRPICRPLPPSRSNGTGILH